MIKVFTLIFCFALVKLQELNANYNLDSNLLISEFSSSTKQCIKKLSPILKQLSVDDQRSLNKVLWTTDESRCFDPKAYRAVIANNLYSINTVSGWKVGNSTNPTVTAFKCLVNSAKKKLDDKDIDLVKEILTSITPYGAYPQYTRCIASYILNTNYVLTKRRRYLFTTNANMESVALKSSADGTYSVFPWKYTERDVLVNEFLRLQRCVNDFSLNLIYPYKRAQTFFANSKKCGVSPGSLDKVLYGDYYNTETKTDSGTSTDPSKPTVAADGKATTSTGATTPTSTPASSGTTSATTGSGSTGSAGATTASTGSAGATTTSTATTKPATSTSSTTSSISTSSLVYDPCYEYNYPTMVVDPAPPTTDASKSGSANSSTTASATTKAVTADSSVQTTSAIAPDASIMPVPNYTKKFCPANVGKDISLYETIAYNTPLLKEAFALVSELPSIVDNIIKCISPNVEGLKYIRDIGTAFDTYYLQPSLIEFMKSTVTDSATLDKVSSLLNSVSISGSVNDFSLTCNNGVCSCPNCTPAIQGTFEFSAGVSPGMFYIHFTKCGSNILYIAILDVNYQRYADVRYGNVGQLNSLASSSIKNDYTCMGSNISNTTPSTTCATNTFTQISSDCKSTLASECNSTGLLDKLQKLHPEKSAVYECDISTVNISNKTEYDTFKSKCFKWINNNLISASINLNINALINLNEIIATKSSIKNLRLLQSSTDVTYSDNNAVDQDTDANFDSEASTGSNKEIDIDGSSQYNIYYAAATGGVATATTADAATDTKGVGAPKVANENGPPTLSSNFINIGYELLMLSLLALFI